MANELKHVIVEEVSLVDRPANRRKFLFFKRNLIENEGGDNTMTKEELEVIEKERKEADEKAEALAKQQEKLLNEILEKLNSVLGILSKYPEPYPYPTKEAQEEQSKLIDSMEKCIKELTGKIMTKEQIEKLIAEHSK